MTPALIEWGVGCLVATIYLFWLLDRELDLWPEWIMEWVALIGIGTASVAVFCAAWLLVAAMRG